MASAWSTVTAGSTFPRQGAGVRVELECGAATLSEWHPNETTTEAAKIAGSMTLVEHENLGGATVRPPNVPGLSCKSRAKRGFCQLQTGVGQLHGSPDIRLSHSIARRSASKIPSKNMSAAALRAPLDPASSNHPNSLPCAVDDVATRTVSPVWRLTFTTPASWSVSMNGLILPCARLNSTCSNLFRIPGSTSSNRCSSSARAVEYSTAMALQRGVSSALRLLVCNERVLSARSRIFNSKQPLSVTFGFVRIRVSRSLVCPEMPRVRHESTNGQGLFPDNDRKAPGSPQRPCWGESRSNSNRS